MNLSSMLTLVRQDLHDQDSLNYRWTDSELTRHIDHAVNDFSLQIPLESTAELPTLAGSREIDLSLLSNMVSIDQVEYPLGRFPPSIQPFTLWSRTLTLLGESVPDGSNCKISWAGLHTLDEEGSSIPVQFENLVIAGACGYAAVQMAGFSINRVNDGGPGTPSDWNRWGTEKLDFFRSELKRLGRNNQVRVGQLSAY